jgi:hypothetical protein
MNINLKLHHMARAATVLETLEATDKTMRYEPFCRAIGMIAPEDKWDVRYRREITFIFSGLAAVEKLDGGTEVLAYERVVDAEGNPGAGFHKTVQIVRT